MSSSPVVHFYDAASPQNIPSGVHAAAYVNGFAWSQAEIDRMGAVIRISVMREAFWARDARVLDCEAGAADPAVDLVPFIRARLEHGWKDATAYVNRSNWPIAQRAVKEAGLTCRWWVATLDGTQNIPGAWAVQYFGGPSSAFDLSVLHGVNDFHRPR